MHGVFGRTKVPSSPTTSFSSLGDLQSVKSFSMSSNIFPDIPTSSLQQSPQMQERCNGGTIATKTAAAYELELHREKLWRNVRVYGDAPELVTLYTAQLNRRVVEELFLHSALQPLQELVIPILLDEKGQNVLMKSPVRSGKTLAYVIAASQMALNQRERRSELTEDNGPAVVILVDTIIRATKIGNYMCNNFEIVDEGQKSHLQELHGFYRRGDFLHYLRRGSYTDILVTSMDTLIDIMQRKKIQTKNLRLLVVDGADRIARSTFEQEMSEVLKLLGTEVRERMRVAVFSAFYEEEEEGWVDWKSGIMAELFKHKRPIEIIVTPAVGYVEQRFILIKEQLSRVKPDDLKAMPQMEAYHKIFSTTVHMQKIGWLRGLLQHEKQLYYKNDRYTKTAVVFVESITTCNFLSTYLLYMGYDVLPLISEHDHVSWKNTLMKLHSGTTQAVITTNEIARRQGILNVHHMIFYEMPQNFNLYKHEVGRTGQFGDGGISTTFFFPKKDFKHVQALHQFLVENEQHVPRWLQQLFDHAQQRRQMNGIFGGPKGSSSSPSEEQQRKPGSSTSDVPSTSRQPPKPARRAVPFDGTMQTTKATNDEEFNAYREMLRKNVFVRGEGGDVEPVTLASAPLSPDFVANLRKIFTDLLPLQERTVPILLHENNYSLLVQSPTGTGKTAAFGIPAIQTALNMKRTNVGQSKKEKGPSAIIVCNTMNLAMQIRDHLMTFCGVKNGISNIGVNVFGLFRGGDPLHRHKDTDVDIIVATMGTLLNSFENRKIETKNLRLLIADEADKMIAHSSFGMEMEKLLDALGPEVRSRLKVAAFSATYVEDETGGIDYSSGVLADFFNNRRPTEIHVTPVKGYIKQRIILIQDPRESLNRLNLSQMTKEEYQRAVFANSVHAQKINWLKGLLDYDKKLHYKDGRYTKTAVVFVERITTCNFLSTYLMYMGYNVLPLNSQYDLAAVKEALKKLGEGSIQAVISTNKLARGQDIPDLHHVIVYEMSSDFDDYKHRIGRTGRIGHGGISTAMLYPGMDMKHIPNLYIFMKYHNQQIPRWLHDAFNRFAEQRAMAQEEFAACAVDF